MFCVCVSVSLLVTGCMWPLRAAVVLLLRAVRLAARFRPPEGRLCQSVCYSVVFMTGSSSEASGRCEYLDRMVLSAMARV